MGYHEPTDTKYTLDLRRAAPKAFDAFVAFGRAAVDDPERLIPRKYSELIAIAVAATTQCPYCIEKHIDLAKAEGASEQEVVEAIMTASALQAGAGFATGFLALKLYRGEHADPAPALAHEH